MSPEIIKKYKNKIPLKFPPGFILKPDEFVIYLDNSYLEVKPDIQIISVKKIWHIKTEAINFRNFISKPERIIKNNFRN